MEILHHGFDNLDLSINSQIPEKLSQKLEAAKEIASQHNQTWSVDYGGVELSVHSHGVSGGYAFLCDTGPMGVTLMFKKHGAKGGWGVRVSFKSLTLALRGFAAARLDVEALCQKLDIPIADRPVSISRVDYAVDLLAPNFDLSQGKFIIHPRMLRKSIAEVEDQGTVGSADNDHSITVGKMPNRQVIFYDKTREVRDKRKVEWPEIWNTHQGTLGKRKLDFGSSENRVWRIELRVGKEYLKKQWNVSGWESLYLALPYIFSELYSSIRFARPTSDSNRARWPSHPVWASLSTVIPDAIFDAVPEFDEDKIAELKSEAKEQILDRQLLGLTVSLAAFLDTSELDFPEFLNTLPERLRGLSAEHPKPLQERLAQASMRHFV